MCAIVGIVSRRPVNQAIYDALTVLQHRGQDAAGITTDDEGDPQPGCHGVDAILQRPPATAPPNRQAHQIATAQLTSEIASLTNPRNRLTAVEMIRTASRM